MHKNTAGADAQKFANPFAIRFIIYAIFLVWFTANFTRKSDKKVRSTLPHRITSAASLPKQTNTFHPRNLLITLN